MEGIAYNLPSNYELWVVKEPFPGNFHPDNGPAILEGSKWYATAYIGNAKPFTDNRLKFKIHIIMAPSESRATKTYRKYLETAHSKGWPGLPSLYGGTIVATVEVVRDDKIYEALQSEGDIEPSIQSEDKSIHILIDKANSPSESICSGRPIEPKIIYEYISNTKKNWIRFCLVQLDYDLAAISLPAEFGWEMTDGYAIKEKIFKALERAHSDKVDIICFPELSFSKEWINEITRMYKDIIIIGGSYYQNGYNICPIIINGYVLDPPYKKCTPSIFETDAVTGRGMKSGDIIHIIQTEQGRFTVLTCSDYTQHSERICRYDKECNGVDFIINPCCDPNLARFQEKASSDCDRFALDVIQVNKAPKGNKYGKSCIIGREHDGIKDILINEKFRPEFDVRHKLCEIDTELMLLVDINIGVKGPLAGIETDYKGRIRIHREKIYEYKNDWLPHESEAKHASLIHKEGCDLFRLGKYAEALETYEKVIRLDPNFTLAWTNKGIVLENLGRYKDALEAYESLIKLCPNHALAWTNKSIVLRKMGMYEEALETLDKSIELSPKEALAWVHKGMVLENLGRYKEAIKVYKNAIYLEPNYSSTCTSKVSSLEKLCRYKETLAFKEIEAYLETEKEIFEVVEIQALQKEEATILSLMDREIDKETEMEFEQWQDTNIHLAEEQGAILNREKEEKRAACLKEMEGVANEEKVIELAEEAHEKVVYLETEKEILDEIEIQAIQNEEANLLGLINREVDKEAETEYEQWQDADIYLIEKTAFSLNRAKEAERSAFLNKMDGIDKEEKAIELAEEAHEKVVYFETEKEIFDEIETQALQNEEATLLDLMNLEADKEAEMEYGQWQDADTHLIENIVFNLNRAKEAERSAFLNKMDEIDKEEKAIELAEEAHEKVVYFETEKEIINEIETQALQNEEATLLSLMNQEIDKEAEMQSEELPDIDNYLANEWAAFLNRMNKEAREEKDLDDYLDRERMVDID
jgi:Tfp pilus assembly protein PilF